MANAYWTREEVIAEISKNDTSKYIVSRCEKDGRKFINVREWYCTRNDPTWKPAKSGMAIPVENGIAEKTLEAMQDVLELSF